MIPLYILMLAIPGAAKLIEILVVAGLLVVILVILGAPQVQIPAPYKLWAIYAISAILIIYLLWQALIIAGVL